ncbi:hypothetical protein [Arthrobacter sp. MP_M7]|nr:hypothetical protein [Arthrobacter sp. MP_M7]
MDVSTLVLNMTFLMTLGIGFLISLAHVLMFATMLVLVGVARLAVLTFTALCDAARYRALLVGAETTTPDAHGNPVRS